MFRLSAPQSAGPAEILLSRSKDSSDGHIPIARPDVFVVGSTVNQHAAFGVEYGDTDPSVAQVVPPEPLPGMCSTRPLLTLSRKVSK